MSWWKFMATRKITSDRLDVSIAQWYFVRKLRPEFPLLIRLADLP
jgi:hypothetical protein